MGYFVNIWGRYIVLGLIVQRLDSADTSPLFLFDSYSLMTPVTKHLASLVSSGTNDYAIR